MTLVFSTNMVLSVESIYCYCFKSTKYALSLSKHDCHEEKTKKHCEESTCDNTCEYDNDHMPCKSKSTITIFTKTDFTKTNSPLTDYTVAVLPQVNFYVFNIETDRTESLIYADPSPPEYLLSTSFLQSFLC